MVFVRFCSLLLALCPAVRAAHPVRPLGQVSNLGTGIIAKIARTPAAGASAGAVTLKDSGFGNLMDSSGPPALPVQILVGTLTLN